MMVLLALLLLSIAAGCMPATVQPQKVNLVFFMAVRRLRQPCPYSCCCCGHRRGGASLPACPHHLLPAPASGWQAAIRWQRCPD